MYYSKEAIGEGTSPNQGAQNQEDMGNRIWNTQI